MLWNILECTQMYTECEVIDMHKIKNVYTAEIKIWQILLNYQIIIIGLSLILPTTQALFCNYSPQHTDHSISKIYYSRYSKPTSSYSRN